MQARGPISANIGDRIASLFVPDSNLRGASVVGGKPPERRVSPARSRGVISLMAAYGPRRALLPCREEQLAEIMALGASLRLFRCEQAPAALWGGAGGNEGARS